ncbi:hypothetical protein glysoja_043804 [Glycine soja]|uniref:Uncharacterized protein n=1 Tax=Glycine soja TaxID=3848 RepID=A0A0B2NY07_GLYSO|nr:hypothetical protein glysoja_043804 [Glycine soja]
MTRMEFTKLNFLLNSKWGSTVVSIWIQCTSGSLYTFSIYSQTIKSTQRYDQSTLEVVSVSKDIGVNVGVLSGLLGFLGLSGAILIQMYRTIFNNKPMSYLLTLALLPPINTLLLMWFVRIHNTHEGEERKYLNMFSSMALVVAAYLMVVIILENILSLQSSVRIFIFVVLIVLLASLLCIAFEAHEKNSGRSFLDEGSPLIVEPSPEDTTEREDAWKDSFNNQRTNLQLGENLNLFQAVKTVNFWVLFVSVACGMGSGLATVNNLGQIGESLGYTSHETGSLVSLWSIWNFLGRFGAGYVSDYYLHTRGWARPCTTVYITTWVKYVYVHAFRGLVLYRPSEKVKG